MWVECRGGLSARTKTQAVNEVIRYDGIDWSDIEFTFCILRTCFYKILYQRF